MKLVVNQTVVHARFGEGKVLELDNKNVVVKFGEEVKNLLLTYAKFTTIEKLKNETKKVIAKRIEKNKVKKLTKNDIFKNLMELANKTTYNRFSYKVFSKGMEIADKKGHFASNIIEKALNGKSITEKQAWSVCFFIEKEGLLK